MCMKKKDVSGTKPEGTAAKDAAADPAKKREPVHSFHEGPIYVSVWGNDVQTKGETRTFYSFTIRRAYQDKYGQMQFTNSIDARSVESLVLAVQRVSEYLQTLLDPDGTAARGG